MRNIIALTFLSLLTAPAAFSEELTLERIKSDFNETINHYNYNLDENELVAPERAIRVRSNTSTAQAESEILNLEDEFQDSITDQVESKASAPIRTRTR